MSFAKTYSAQPVLLKAGIIDVEVDLAKGLNAFTVVGLPDKAVEESKDRVSAAIKNSGFTPPKQKNQKTVIALAPADIKKEGPIFDLAIALAYLIAAKEIDFDVEKKLFLGELSLDGSLRPVAGVLPLVAEARERGFEEVYVPLGNAREAALIDGITIYPAKSLSDVINHLIEGEKPEKDEGGNKVGSKRLSPQPKTEIEVEYKTTLDFNDIKGQQNAKRGLEIAAAGGHNIALWGPAGTGKTLLAKAFAGILPPLTMDEVLEVTGIHSIAGVLHDNLITTPPWRNPHHTASYVSITGGGAIPKPGEATLAHRGVLFLDEFPEFDSRVINTLREPLEEGVVRISRARGSAEFPANFILVAALNPCPCGNWGVKGKQCTCLPIAIERYKRKLSGPIVDRIDLWTEVSSVDHASLSTKERSGEESRVIRERVAAARNLQRERFAKLGLKHKTNSNLGAKDIAKVIELSPKVKAELDRAAAALDLSARSYHKVMKVAQTIADLFQSEKITADHLHEALQYRPKRVNYE
jgi:magnesium chelatase family protein